MNRTILLLCVFALIAACSPRNTVERADRVQEGWTEKQVARAIGNPTGTKKTGSTTRNVYRICTYNCAAVRSQRVTTVFIGHFEDGVLTSFHEDEVAANRSAEMARAEASRPVIIQNNPPPVFQPVYQQPYYQQPPQTHYELPKTTHCVPDGMGGMRCTTQ